MQLDLTERMTNVYIAKSPRIDANINEITFVKTRCNDASEIFKNTFNSSRDNQFTTVIPFVREDIPKRTSEYLSFSGIVQPIVLEFDHCAMDLQQKRVQFLSDELNTPMFVVHSGNKSLHLYLFFKQFAEDKEEYKRRCKQLVAYLAKNYPTYFKEQTDSNEKHELVPDYRMFTGNRYARQANGRRDSGKIQEATILHDIEDGIEPMDLVALVGDSVPGNGSGGSSTPVNRAAVAGAGDDKPQNKEPRKATLQFIAMGVDEGGRDDACFKAACDLRDCGYTKDRALERLLEGAKKCTPEFPESEVKIKLESAWNSGGYYDPIDKTRPFPFIEKNTSAYYYTMNGTLYQARKEVLKDILKSSGVPMPEKFTLFEFKYDVHDNNKIDIANQQFNLFTPTKYHLMSSNGASIDLETDCPNIHKLLVNLFVNVKERNHFLNWLACALQTRKKLLTAYVLKGEQGAGKGVLFSHIIKPLFGEMQTMQVEDEQLKRPFNGYMKDICFVAFNEVAHNNYGRNALNSKIKAIITDPNITIEEKFIQPYVIKNCVNCMFFSNEDVPLLVERSDRRFNVVETGGALTKCSWFDPMVVLPQIHTELEWFAQYLWNLHIDLSRANRALDNDIKKRIISAGLNRFEEFAVHLKAVDIPWLLDNITDNSFEKITDKDLASLRAHWIIKDLALRLFNKINPENKASVKGLTTKLRLHGIEDGRLKSSSRERIYHWSR